jgi:hypothetical protein
MPACASTISCSAALTPALKAAGVDRDVRGREKPSDHAPVWVDLDLGALMEQKWPQQLWLVRHGQSAGNVARDAAEAGKSC